MWEGWACHLTQIELKGNLHELVLSTMQTAEIKLSTFTPLSYLIAPMIFF